MNRTLLSLLVIVVLVALAVPALAQDSVPTPTITPTPSPTALPPVVPPPVTDYTPSLPDVPQPLDVLTYLYAALLPVIATVVQSPLGSALVAVVKRITPRIPIKFVQDMDAAAINLVVTVVIVGLVWLANVTGFRDHFEVAAQVVVAVVSVIIGSKAGTLWYGKVAQGVPYLGTERKPVTGKPVRAEG